MNKNPLLIKSALMGEIPFIKEKTKLRYGKFISEGKFQKTLENIDQTETLTAYTMNSEYKTEFVFDKVTISSSKSFSEGEWIALGMLLRAYREVEGVNLLHLYNCLYKGENNVLYGKVIRGRSYSLYTSTLLPVTIKIGRGSEIVVDSMNSIKPYIFTAIEIKDGETLKGDSILDISIEFTGNSSQPCMLAEGEYGSLLDSNNSGVDSEGKVKKLSLGPNKLVPQILGIGEYSDRLVEFFAGTLATKLSNPKVFSQASQTAFSLPMVHNKDGYYGKEVQS